MGTIAKKEVPEYLLGENQYETEHNVQLYDAATKGDYAALKKALEDGANPNFISKSGEQVSARRVEAWVLFSTYTARNHN